jgi:hypothetical protein
MKKIGLFGSIFVLTMIFSTSVFAGYSLRVTPPTVAPDDPSNNAQVNLANAINAALRQQSVLDQVISPLNSEHFSKVGDLKDMSRGFANSAAVASYAGTNQSFQNYDLFSLMGGMMIGVAMPKSGDAADQIDKKGDVYFGMTPALAVNLGLHCSFISENLYLSGKVGYVKVKKSFGDVDIDAKQYLLGFGLNYTLIKEWTLFPGILKWRGFSFGTGLTYLNSKNKITVPFDGDYTATANVSGTDYSFLVNNVDGKFSVTSNSLSVPLDIVTSLQVLILNIGLGVGADLNLPSTSITTGGKADVHMSSSMSGVHESSAGSISANQTTDSKAKFFDRVNPKLMASAGLNIAMVKIDVPAIYYPVTNTFGVGVCAGIVW